MRLEENTRERKNSTEQKNKREKGPRAARSHEVMEDKTQEGVGPKGQ